MSKTATVKQKNNINVIGVRRGSRFCPSDTWQIKAGSGNPKDSPICSNLDSDICKKFGFDAKARWANPVRLDNGSVVSLNGMVECTFDDPNDEDQSVCKIVVNKSNQYDEFITDCFLDHQTKDCPNDNSNANGPRRGKPMSTCSPLTFYKSLDSSILPDKGKKCILQAKTFPNELYNAMETYCGGKTGFEIGNDCMCANTKDTFKLEGYTWAKDKEFWDGLTVENQILYNQRGAWLKSCQSKSYLNSVCITSTGNDLKKTCKELDAFLNNEKKKGNLDKWQLGDFQDLSVCYKDNKFTGGGTVIPSTALDFLGKYFWYIILVLAIIIIILIIVAYMKKKTK